MVNDFGKTNVVNMSQKKANSVTVTDFIHLMQIFSCEILSVEFCVNRIAISYPLFISDDFKVTS